MAVLAVNSWNEPKDEVKRFMKDHKLSHRVLLDGREVGEQKYRVGPVPANFWINREGKIVRYEGGFGKGEEKKMEEWIKEILPS